jgi:hypothetical protein
LWLFPAERSEALTADQAFADGNRLFRDDLYWAALLRYRQAGEAGLDTPLLYYNAGVAHYRAKQHVRARASLLRAAQSPSLRVLAQYNLGLNAYAAGDPDEALDWFRQARDQEERPDIRRLAIIAISRLQSRREESDALLARSEKRETEKPIANFDFRARIGFGSDDNVFRTPSQPYVDFSDPEFPIVVPEVESGLFTPIDLDLKYAINSLKFESFYAGYRLAGRYYQDKGLENANEFSHEARFGNEYHREDNNRERRIHSAFTFAQHDETYFDPDDGTARSNDGVAIDDRMNYVRYGPQIEFLQSYARLSFGLRLKGQLWNYEKTGAVPEYDHEYLVAGANVQYRFDPTLLLRFTLDKYSRRYGDRPAFNLDGEQLITNPALRYDYLEAGLTMRQRITDSLWLGFNYVRTERTDRYVGYNDYSRNQYGIDLRWRLTRSFRVEFSGYLRNYSYPNAFAFHNPLAGGKTLETSGGSLLASYRVNRNLSFIAEAELRDSLSNDARINYDRAQFSLGVSWQQ